MFRQTLLAAVAAGGERSAVSGDDGSVSYAALWAWSGELAGQLAAAGVRPGDCAVLVAGNGPGFLAGYLAVLRAGMLAAPVNSVCTGAELERVLQRSAPRVVLADPAHHARLRELCDRSAGATRLLVLDPEQAPAADGRAPQHEPADAADAPGDACLLMHTSGTTGACKAVVQTETALHLTTGLWRALHRLPGETVALPVPLAHTYGHLAACATLLAGGSLLLSARDFDPQWWIEAADEHEAAVIEAVPTVYARLLRAAVPGRPVLPRLRLALSAGMAAEPELRAAWQQRTGLALRQSWGMTELAGTGLAPLPGCCPQATGLPVPGLEVRVVAQGRGADEEPESVAEGGTGELWVRGPQVTPGERVSDRHVRPLVDAHGWLRTGDLVNRDAHGCVTVVGRCKDSIMTGGYTVQPAEVENILLGHPHVAQALVVGCPDPERGEAPHALVVSCPGTVADPEALRSHVRGMLARYKVPRTVHVLGQLPVTSTGKPDRVAARALVAAVAGGTGPVPLSLGAER